MLVPISVIVLTTIASTIPGLPMMLLLSLYQHRLYYRYYSRCWYNNRTGIVLEIDKTIVEICANIDERRFVLLYVLLPGTYSIATIAR